MTIVNPTPILLAVNESSKILLDQLLKETRQTNHLLKQILEQFGEARQDIDAGEWWKKDAEEPDEQVPPSV